MKTPNPNLECKVSSKNNISSICFIAVYTTYNMQMEKM